MDRFLSHAITENLKADTLLAMAPHASPSTVQTAAPWRPQITVQVLPPQPHQPSSMALGLGLSKTRVPPGENGAQDDPNWQVLLS